MMFALSTLLLAETVLAMDVPVLPPQPRAPNLRGDNLAKKMSVAITEANLGELKTLGTDQTMTKIKEFVDEKLLDKKIEVIEKRLGEGLEEKLNEALSATTAIPLISIESEEKLIADELVNEAIDQTVTDPKVAVVEKTIEHFIVHEVIDSLAERKKKAEAGEEVSDEEDNKKLVLKIIADIMGMLKDVPAERKVGIEEMVTDAVTKAVEANVSTKEGGGRALQQALGRVAFDIAKATIIPPIIAAPAEIAYNVAQAVVVQNQDAFAQLAGVIDQAIGIGPIVSTGWNLFSTFMFR